MIREYFSPRLQFFGSPRSIRQARESTIGTSSGIWADREVPQEPVREPGVHRVDERHDEHNG